MDPRIRPLHVLPPRLQSATTETIYPHARGPLSKSQSHFIWAFVSARVFLYFHSQLSPFPRRGFFTSFLVLLLLSLIDKETEAQKR